jgi:8-oxo-dGTP pyrophosphatase MutT (NUDIX family)
VSSLPPAVETYLEEITERLRDTLGAALTGVYLHGSAVLGDFSQSRSDIDVIAVSARPLSAHEKTWLARRLSQSALPCPATSLEFHVVHRDDTAARAAPPFQLHVATSTDGRPDRVVDGSGRPGDPDLVMHFAVLHEHGRALLGPPAERVFPAIPREMLLDALCTELAWARENASPSDQVLNACRAWRYVDEGVLGSKTAGGEWARERVDDLSLIDAALRHRKGLTDSHPDPDAARVVLLDALQSLETRTGAAAVIFDSEGRVLLVKENYERRRYSFPGGAVGRGETPEEAVVREVLEETGVTAAVDGLVGSYCLDNGFVVHAFACSILSGEPRVPATGEIAEVGWYLPGEIARPVSNVLHYALPDAVRGLRDIRRENLSRVS